MNIEFEDDQLFITCSGSRFLEEVESCKLLGMRYDPNKRAWSISPGFLDQVLEEMKQYNLVISEYDKQQIKKYFDTLNELSKTTKRSEWRKFHSELLKVCPLMQDDNDGVINESD
jgi:hypothetical protein